MNVGPTFEANAKTTEIVKPSLVPVAQMAKVNSLPKRLTAPNEVFLIPSLKMVYTVVTMVGTIFLTACSVTSNSAFLSNDESAHNTALLRYARGY